MTEDLNDAVLQLTTLVDQITTEVKVLRKDREALRVALRWVLETTVFPSEGDRWELEDLLKRTNH
jgi:hypothetical protein